MKNRDKLEAVAKTDKTFELRDGNWVGKCLICNGPIAFSATTGEGATVEHIRARSRGGTEDLENLAVVHFGCNNEKGRRWDPKRIKNPQEYETFIEKLLTKRKERMIGS